MPLAAASLPDKPRGAGQPTITVQSIHQLHGASPRQQKEQAVDDATYKMIGTYGEATFTAEEVTMLCAAVEAKRDEYRELAQSSRDTSHKDEWARRVERWEAILERLESI